MSASFKLFIVVSSLAWGGLGSAILHDSNKFKQDSKLLGPIKIDFTRCASVRTGYPYPCSLTEDSHSAVVTYRNRTVTTAPVKGLFQLSDGTWVPKVLL